DRGRVAEPRAVVHVVRPHDDAAELLDRVAVLVGGFGAREGPEPLPMAREAIGRRLERLLPGHLDPAAVAPDHRVGDPIARVEKACPEPSLDAERAEAGR